MNFENKLYHEISRRGRYIFPAVMGEGDHYTCRWRTRSLREECMHGCRRETICSWKYYFRKGFPDDYYGVLYGAHWPRVTAYVLQ